MTTCTSRTYSGPHDLQSMLDLLVAVRPADQITDYPGIVDLHELLALRNVQNNTRLWLGDNDEVVGFALVDQYGNLLFEIGRKATCSRIESEMVTWGMQCVRLAAAQGSDEPETLDTSCRDGDGERTALLERHGFVRQAVRSLHMMRSLDEPIPAPRIPKGFTIRHVADEQEAPELVALHRAAFGSENMTVEERLAIMRAPEYDRELDLLAIAPVGRSAAYCLCSISREANRRNGRNAGYMDTVATHPDFQRLGLARALLVTGLHRLKQCGVKTAVLGTSSENIAMQRVAEAVGFCVESTTLWFAKPSPMNQTAD